MANRMVTSYLFLLMCVLGTCMSQESQGVRFTSPANETLRTFNAPMPTCAYIAPPQGSGFLLSYEALRKQLLYGDRLEAAMKVLAPVSVLLITSTNLADGNLVPFHNDTKRNDLVAEKVKSWRPQGVIVRNTVARSGGQAEFGYNQREWCYNMDITWLEVGFYDGLTLERMSEANIRSPDLYHVIVAKGDVNHWQVLRKSGFMVFWRFFMSITAGMTAIISLYKLMVYIKVLGPSLTVPQLTLVILLIGSLFRCIYTAVDPVYMGYTNMYGRQAHMLITIHMPIFPITTLLLALYWKEVMTSSNVNASGFLSKMKIPFIVLSFIAILVEVVSSSLRAAEVGTLGPAALTTGAVYIIIIGASSIFFVVMGIQIIRRLKSTAAAANVKSSIRSQAMLRRTTLFVMTTAFFGLCFVAGLIQVISDDWFWSTTGFIVSWSCTYLGAFGGALVQALTIRAPEEEELSKSTARTLSATPRSTSAQTQSQSDGNSA